MKHSTFIGAKTGIEDQECEAIALGQFSLDCTSMLLRQDRNDDPDSYSGPGTISQDEHGNLKFKLFSDRVPDVKRVFDEFNNPDSAGLIIPPERYYSLEAQDLHGRVWYASRVLPSRTQGAGIVVTGMLHEILHRTERNSSGKTSFVHLRYPDKHNFPCNVTTEACIKAGDREVNRSYHFDRAKVTTALAEFEFYNDDHFYNAVAYCDQSSLPPHFADRITDALEFLVAKPLRSTISEIGTDNQLETTIRNPVYKGFKGSSRPPFSAGPINDTGSYWRLFDLYLQHICKKTDEGRHPLSRAIHSIIVSSDSSIEARALRP